jgi:transposase InsO family protein
LVDGRKLKSVAVAQAKADDAFVQYLATYWLNKRGRSMAVAYDRAVDKAQEMGWTICSYRHAQRILKKIPLAEQIKRREGDKAFTDKVEPNIRRDWSDVPANRIWNADHHNFDVLVKVGQRVDPNTGEEVAILKRPWLSAWQDCRSRKIVGWCIRAEDPNTDAILLAFRHAVLTHGLPDKAYTDNGKTYDCRYLTGQTKAMRWARRAVKVEHDQQILGGLRRPFGGIQRGDKCARAGASENREPIAKRSQSPFDNRQLKPKPKAA